MSYPPPPAYPPAPQSQPDGPLRGRTPRRLGWIFLVVAIALFVVGGVVIAKKSLSKVNDFDRVSIADGGGPVTLDGTRKWVGYYEADDVSSDTNRIPNFSVLVTGPGGAKVDLQRYGNRSDGKVDKFTYEYNGHHGIAVFQFKAPEKGEYQIRLQADQTLPSDAGVAIGRDIAKGTIAGALFIVGGVVFLIAAIVLLIVCYVKRSRHKSERQQAQMYGGYGQPAFGAPGGYPPPPGYGQPPAYPQQQQQPQGYNPPPPNYGEQPPQFQKPPQQPRQEPPQQPGQEPGQQPPS